MNLELRDDVLNRVRTAFDEVPYPGGNKIFAHERTEDYIGQHWKQLSLEFIVSHRSDLPLFNAESFHFYLPAFLIHALLHPNEVDTLISNLVYNLAPPEFINGSDQAAFTHKMQQFDIRISTFDSQQKETITIFLQSFKRLYPNESWSILESEEKRLDHAIEIWSTL